MLNHAFIKPIKTVATQNRTMFQLRSNWAQFLRFSIFERVAFSITYVFSTAAKP
jgi:hypothetical protein